MLRNDVLVIRELQERARTLLNQAQEHAQFDALRAWELLQHSREYQYEAGKLIEKLAQAGRVVV